VHHYFKIFQNAGKIKRVNRRLIEIIEEWWIINKVILIGRITKDLELRTTKSGNSVSEFTLAVNRDKEKTDFITCQVWNKQAENLCKYQQKGSLISVIGEIRTESYEINDKKHYRIYVLVNQVEYLSTTQKSQEKANNDLYKEFGESIKTESNIGEQLEISPEDYPFWEKDKNMPYIKVMSLLI
jgi:single-strand DNA-binding protein